MGNKFRTGILRLAEELEKKGKDPSLQFKIPMFLRSLIFTLSNSNRYDMYFEYFELCNIAFK